MLEGKTKLKNNDQSSSYSYDLVDQDLQRYLINLLTDGLEAQIQDYEDYLAFYDYMPFSYADAYDQKNSLMEFPRLLSEEECLLFNRYLEVLIEIEPRVKESLEDSSLETGNSVVANLKFVRDLTEKYLKN